MEIINRRDKIKQARGSWESQYGRYTDHYSTQWKWKNSISQIRANLAALNLETCSVADVDNAIGVTGWGSLECDECHTDHEHMIRFGQTPDYEARWQDLCLPCLKRAVWRLQAKLQPPTTAKVRRRRLNVASRNEGSDG